MLRHLMSCLIHLDETFGRKKFTEQLTYSRLDAEDALVCRSSEIDPSGIAEIET